MLILASSSPRRKELLAQIGCKFVCRPSSCEELTFRDEPNPQKLVMQNAILKAKASVDNHHKDEIILGSDTVVALASLISAEISSPKKALAVANASRQSAYR